ncbi:MAG: hypothetical protein QOF51_1342, partial [Chloroflexota bacterium]|nr:hypothetical protein [Chloroflexota bacterium]
VSAGFDGVRLAWRWDVTPPTSPILAEVVLYLVAPAAGSATLEVGVLLTPADWRLRSTFFTVDRGRVASALEADESWLTEALRTARHDAYQRLPASARGDAKVAP